MTTEAQCCRTAQQKDQHSGVSSPRAEKQGAGHLGTAEVFRKWQEALWVGLTLGPCRSEVQTQVSAGQESRTPLYPRPGWSISQMRGTQSPQYSCLENPHGQRSLASYSQWGRNHSLRVGHNWEIKYPHTQSHSWKSTRRRLRRDRSNALFSIQHRAWHLPGTHNQLKVKVLVTQLCPTLCHLMDCRLPGFSVHGILQARILEWVAIPFSRGSSPPRG